MGIGETNPAPNAKDGKVLRAKIVGMGVSLVVGTAARRAFEKCVLNK